MKTVVKTFQNKVLVLLIALLLTATLGAQNLTVTLNGSTTVTAQNSLQDAITTSSIAPGSITSIEITAGDFVTADWNYLKANRSSFSSMTDFTITNGITSVDDIPDTGAYSGTYLNAYKVERISVAKVENIGNNAFRNSTTIESVSFPDAVTIGNNSFSGCSNLTSISFPKTTTIEDQAFSSANLGTNVSFPKVTTIGQSAFRGTTITSASFPEVTTIEGYTFYNSRLSSISIPKVTSIGVFAFYRATNFTELRIGATPPSVTIQYGNNPFVQTPDTRYLTIIDNNDTPLTGTALTNARTAYQAVNDGNASDNKWYGWTTNADYTITYTATTNGSVTGSVKVAESEIINLTITPDTNYQLQAGSLKAFKTGEPTTTVTITNNSFTMPAYDVTVEAVFEQLPMDMSVTFNNATTLNSQASLEGAITNSGIALNAITSIEVTSGTFRSTDWEYLKTNKNSFTAMTDFTITNGTASVANIADQYFYFSTIENIDVSKAQDVAGSAFTSLSKLKKVSLPNVNNIGFFGFNSCSLLTDLHIGAIPPTASTYSFWNLPTTRFLTFVDTDGNPLSGTALTNAQATYKAVNDGNTTDNLWYGWAISGAYNINHASASNGNISGNNKAEENEQVSITITPNPGYQLQAGSLKVYETGNINTTVNLTSYDTFVMPAFDVTVEAIFEIAPPLTVSVNGKNSVTGSSFENILTNETLSDIISIEITAGVFTTADWNYLKTNRNNLFNLKHFTITNGIGHVDDIPNTGLSDPYFYRYSVENVSIAKLSNIGDYAFRRVQYLKSVTLPNVKHINGWAFSNSYQFEQLKIGRIPPVLGNNVFPTNAVNRYLVFVDDNGNQLTESYLTNAKASYKTVDDGNTSDNLWYGLNIEPTLYQIEDISTNGSVLSNYSTAIENQTINLTPIANEGYVLQAGSLKVFKTGEPNTIVTNTLSFTMPAYDVTIEATFNLALAVSINGASVVYGSSLQDALSGTTLSSITSLEISAGNFTTSDWEYLRDQSNNISALTSFKITNGINSVADIPNSVGGQRYFNNTLETVSVAKVKSVGNGVFSGSNIRSVKLPEVTSLGEVVVHPYVTKLYIGATPPSVGTTPFNTFSDDTGRHLIFIDANGTPLTGTDLTNAQTAYEAVNDGDTTDKKWYSWITNADYNITYTNATNGTIEGIDKAGENQEIKVTVTPDLGYELQGTLNVYKTGEPGTTVTVSADNTFTMPAYDVTVEGTFVQLPPLQVTINGIRNKSAVLLRNVMNGEDLSTITSLEITGGKFVDDDWKYLHDNRASFTSMTDFTITSTITSVENLRYFGFNENVIQNISVAKLERIEDHGFRNSTTLQSLTLPNVTYIGEHGFEGCTVLNQLNIGATPPSTFYTYAFGGTPKPRGMTIIDANGTPLTGLALTSAQSAYQASDDGNTTDNLWLGWKIDTSLFNIYFNKPFGTKGDITVSGNSLMAADENDPITLVITPDVGYQMQAGSLKVYKTGDESTTVTVSGTNSFTMPAYDITVGAVFEQIPLQVTINGTTNKTGTSLQNVMNGVTPSTITSLEVTGGSFTTADWNYLRNYVTNFTALTDFTITNTIEQVADIPDLFGGARPYFKRDVIENISVAKVKKIGLYAFSGSTALTSVSIPNATVLSNNAFSGCTALTQLSLGALPPSVSSNVFVSNPDQRNLVLADVDGTPLTGVNLTNARTAYKAVDINPNDNLWYGWKIDPNLYNIFNNSTRGTVTVTSGIMAGAENEVINLVITPFTNYQLQAGSLKAYKTGDTNTVVTISNTNSFTMPAYDVTIEAVFELINVPFDIVINDSNYLSGASLENALSGVDLSTITSLEVRTGKFTTADWNYLKNNRSNLTSMIRFSINSGITSVANIPNTTTSEPYFNTTTLGSITVHKLDVIGENAFYGITNLHTTSFPDVTTIESNTFTNCTALDKNLFPKLDNIKANAFNGCTSLTHLNLGLTPPSNVAVGAFNNIPNISHLQFKYNDGTTPSNTDNANAVSAYRAITDGNTNDNFWYGWLINNTLYSVGYQHTGLGLLSGSSKYEKEGETVNLTLTPNPFYKFKEGSLKVFKNGDENITITVTNNSFIMPNYSVIVRADFEPKANAIELTINDTNTKTGYTLEDALTNETLSNITKLEINTGVFTTDDWNFLKTNSNNFTSLTSFTIANTMTTVLDTPLKASGESFFRKDKIEHIKIAKMRSLGNNSFEDYTALKTVELPDLINFGTHTLENSTAITNIFAPKTETINFNSFSNCTSLQKFTLDATPPAFVGINTFLNLPTNRYITLVDENGIPLTGTALINAKTAYKAVNDGNTNDNLWYGWKFRNPVIWTGATNTNWNTATNWSNGEVPLLNDDVIINSGTNHPVLNGTTSVTLNNVTLENNTSIFIEENASITINGNLELKTNAELKVTSTIPSAGTINSSSIILKGTYTEATPNSFTYFTETYHNNDDGWTFVSPPTIGQIIDGGATGFAMYNQLKTSAKGNYGISTYDNLNTTNKWKYYTISQIMANNNVEMTSGKGYSIYPNSTASVNQNKGKIRFKGAIPTTNITITVATNSGVDTNKFNLIGNPYPAFIPANTNANTTNNILTTNSGILSEQTLWFWNKETQSYITVNQASTSRFIAPTQGFFVKAIDNGNFNFTKTMQSHQLTGMYNKNSNLRPEINLTISQNGITQGTDIYYIDGTTKGFDNGYDSSIFNGETSKVNVFTALVENNVDMQLAIQSLPNNNFDAMIIPIGITAEANKEVTLSATKTNLPSDVNVYLEDRLLGEFNDISTQNYTVTFHESVNSTGRFFLHTSSQALSNDEKTTSNTVHVYTTKNLLNISGLASKKAIVKMYDLVGKEVINSKVEIQNLVQISIPSSISKGVYIVNISTENGLISKKVILK